MFGVAIKKEERGKVAAEEQNVQNGRRSQKWAEEAEGKNEKGQRGQRERERACEDERAI